jgi:dihydroorotate dehydrogenase electron transfer subunit
MTPQRNTIYVEDALVENQVRFDNGLFVISLAAPKTAIHAKPGQFIHLQCDESLPMRRPLSIMNTDGDCIHIMYKVIGEGLEKLTQKKKGDTLNLLGPIGNGFEDIEDKLIIGIGGGVGIPPVYFNCLSAKNAGHESVLFMGSEIGWPFDVSIDQQKLYPSEPENMLCVSSLKKLNLSTRLASMRNEDGIYRGYVTDLAKEWLNLADIDTAKCHVVACGPEPMLKSVAALAKEMNLSCDIAIEEYMACGIGGCAGCAVKVYGADGSHTMQRVCVDGPVFKAESIYP